MTHRFACEALHSLEIPYCVVPELLWDAKGGSGTERRSFSPPERHSFHAFESRLSRLLPPLRREQPVLVCQAHHTERRP